MSGKTVLAIIICFFVVGVTSQEDECDSLTLDPCGEKLFKHMLDMSEMPSNDQQLDEVCKDFDLGINCIKDYLNRCPHIHEEEHVDRFLHALETTVHDVCIGQMGKRLLPYGSCMREKMPPIFTCNKDVIPLFEAVAVYEPLTERLHLACCAFVNLERCLTNATVTACGRQANRALKVVFQGYATYIIERCLPTLASGQKCDMSVLKGIEPKNGRISKTVLPPFADIVETVF